MALLMQHIQGDIRSHLLLTVNLTKPEFEQAATKVEDYLVTTTATSTSTTTTLQEYMVSKESTTKENTKARKEKDNTTNQKEKATQATTLHTTKEKGNTDHDNTTSKDEEKAANNIDQSQPAWSLPNDNQPQQLQQLQQMPLHSSASTTFMIQPQQTRLENMQLYETGSFLTAINSINATLTIKQHDYRSATTVANTHRHKSNDKRRITRALHPHTTETTETTRSTNTNRNQRRTNQHLRNQSSNKRTQQSQQHLSFPTSIAQYLD
eukprot:562616-Amphidinium_carterae.2